MLSPYAYYSFFCVLISIMFANLEYSDIGDPVWNAQFCQASMWY